MICCELFCAPYDFVLLKNFMTISYKRGLYEDYLQNRQLGQILDHECVGRTKTKKNIIWDKLLEALTG